MTMLSQNVNQMGAFESQLDVTQEEHASGVNVGDMERYITGAVGGLLLLGALKKNVPGLLVAGLGGALIYRAVSGYCPAYQALGINTSGTKQESDPGAQPGEYFNHGIHVAETFTIAKPPSELYSYWKNFENLPNFMCNLESVKRIDESRSHWVAKGPGGYRVEWDAQIINDEPDYLIAWRSLGADVDNAGSVRFLPMPGARGTEVRVTIEYIPPMGRMGAAIAKLFGANPEKEIREDLKKFKQLMEG